jgi:hypothetical protein
MVTGEIRPTGDAGTRRIIRTDGIGRAGGCGCGGLAG